MKTISKQAVRNKVIGNVLASLRIERLAPSAMVVQAMQACMDGKETTANVLQQVKQRHVALRRV